MKEKKHRVEDALQATRAALEEGIVPGGGVALLVAQNAIDLDGFDDPDEKTGARIVRRALEEPMRQIAENAGLEGSVVVNGVRKAKKGQGLNAANGEIVDLVKEGIIDPAMVRARRSRTPRRSPRTSSHRGDRRRGAGEGVRRRRRWHARHVGDDVIRRDKQTLFSSRARPFGRALGRFVGLQEVTTA